MRRVTLPLRGLALVALLLVALAGTARAEEPSALERLTPEERAHLEKQVPGWSDLSPERQERIARSVLRIREMPEKERRALLARIEQLKRWREAGRGPRPDRLKHHLDPRRRDANRQRGQIVKAVGNVLWAELDEETRQAIDRTFGANRRERVLMSFFRRLVDRIAQERATEGIPPIQVPEGAPPEWMEAVVRLRAKADTGDERARKQLALMSVFEDLHGAAAELGRDGRITEEEVRRLGAGVRERYPKPWADTLAELVAAAKDEATLRRYAPQGPRGPRPRHGMMPMREQARRLLEALRDAAPFLERHPELREHAELLEQRLRRLMDAEGFDRPGPPPPPGPGGPHRDGPRRGPGGRRGPPPDDDGPR